MSPCCDCSGTHGLCSSPARQLRQTLSPVALGTVLLAVGILGGSLVIMCTLKGAGRGKGQLGVAIGTVNKTAKYSRVSKNISDLNGDVSEDTSDDEGHFLIVDR